MLSRQLSMLHRVPECRLLRTVLFVDHVNVRASRLYVYAAMVDLSYM
jgi:hypothetical protein